MLVDKELDKLEELQQEYKAMIELKIDEDIIQNQKQKIVRQKLKISKMIDNIK